MIKFDDKNSIRQKNDAYRLTTPMMRAERQLTRSPQGKLFAWIGTAVFVNLVAYIYTLGEIEALEMGTEPPLQKFLHHQRNNHKQEDQEL
jgi:hypothetical protein